METVLLILGTSSCLLGAIISFKSKGDDSKLLRAICLIMAVSFLLYALGIGA